MRPNRTIYIALTANLLIAVIKFISGFVTHSTAMFSEGVHSLVDTANQLLLLLGIRLSRKSADARRPFGYGKELYFWSFIVSLLIFAIGGSISILQGINHLRHPLPPHNPFWNYIVLACSFLFDGSSLVVAIIDFKKVKGEKSWWTAVHQSKDPSSFQVLFEDSAAVLGVIVVAILLYLGHKFNNPYLDGVASLFVGVLLTVVSVLLARESRSLLMGEGIAPGTQVKIRSIVENDEAIEKLLQIFSTYQSPEEVMLLLLVRFKHDLDTQAITDAISRVKAAIRNDFPFAHYIIITPGE
ncbi:cation diffusion facilitator family transporter [Chitinophaga sp.]|uniref:cation diffusion facilitator family transporter n=1 Tax=Chitinophaga sp. TaxID=1869181 RepID=UPI0031D0689E